MIIPPFMTHASLRDATALNVSVRRFPVIYFNSRVPTGRDTSFWRFSSAFSVFQLTRPYGTRHHVVCVVDLVILDFNSRVPTGRDQQGGNIDMNLIIFQLTRPYGTRPVVVFDDQGAVFISTHASLRDATAV